MAARLALGEVAPDTFQTHLTPPEGHVFGGLLIGQAVRAAQLTVRKDKPVHSLHLSFALAGQGGEPIRYAVERTRDGASFATRRVVARQSQGVVAVLTADFHRDEPGVEFQRPGTPGVPGPDGLAAGRVVGVPTSAVIVRPEPRPASTDRRRAQPDGQFQVLQPPVDAGAVSIDAVSAGALSAGALSAGAEPADASHTATVPGSTPWHSVA